MFDFKWDRTKQEVDIKRTINIMKMTQEQFYDEFTDLKLANLLNHELITEINDYINSINKTMYKIQMHLKDK